MTRGFEIAKGWEDKNINLPIRSTKNSAAYDIEAAEDIIIPPYTRGMNPTLIPTGLKAYCQSDEWYMLVNRSSGPKKLGLVYPHGFGVIDADYYCNPDNDGHIMVQCFNVKDEPITIKKGDRVGQIIFMKYLTIDNDNALGTRTGGFGSTNK